MSERSPLPHPLDADDAPESIGRSAPVETRGRRPAQPLLRISIGTLVGSFAATFLAGVASSNALPNSATETIGSTISRLGGLFMLVSCCGILLAYRLPHLPYWTLPPGQSRGDLLGSVRQGGYGPLVVTNLLALLVVAFAAFGLAGFGAATYFGLSILAILGIPLLVTMAIWHRGFMQAYAIGFLTSLVVIFFSASGLMLRGGYSRGFGYDWSVLVMTALPAAAGLICAGYVRLFRLDSR